MEVDVDDSTADEAASTSSARTTAAARTAVAPITKRIAEDAAYCLAGEQRT
jgi:hypothetical protein